MGRLIDGFSFNDFCLKCQKISENRIEMDGRDLFGVCSICGQKRVMANVNQIYYPKTELWVTRFKIGNLPNVVAGKLLDAAKTTKS